MTAKSGAERGKEHASRLKDYLASNKVLPNRAGKINVTAIARACGFDRQVLYSNPACKALIESAAQFKSVEARAVSGEEYASDQMVSVSKLRAAERRIGTLDVPSRMIT